MRWTVETLDIVDDELQALPSGLQARLLRLMEMIEAVGSIRCMSRMSSTWRASSGSFGPRRLKASLAAYTLP
jgi:hypothetical protein